MDFFQFRESLTEGKVDDLYNKLEIAMSKGDYGLASRLQKQINSLPASAKSGKFSASKKKVSSTKKKTPAPKKEPKPTWKSLSAGDKRKIGGWGEHAEIDSGDLKHGNRDVSKNPHAEYFQNGKYEGETVDAIYLLDDAQGAIPNLVYKSDRVPNNKLQDAINYWVHEVMGAYN